MSRMYVHLHDTTQTARIDFNNLASKSWEKAQENGRFHGSDDIRCDFFVIFSQLNLWLLIQLDTFLELLESNSTKISKYASFTPNDRIQFLLQCDTLNRASYCTNAMFYVEHFLNVIGGRIGVEKDGYYSYTKRLLSSLNIYDDNKFKTLNAPAQIRNSLHNNGCPDRDFEVTIRGRLYKFTKSKPIIYTGWGSLYIFFDELLNVMIEITDKHALRKIPKIKRTSEYNKWLP
jgi:hypothetical protein